MESRAAEQLRHHLQMTLLTASAALTSRALTSAMTSAALTSTPSRASRMASRSVPVTHQGFLKVHMPQSVMIMSTVAALDSWTKFH